MPSTSDNALQGIFCKLEERLNRARRLHPRFAENVFHALSFLSAEHGEVCQAVCKGRTGWRSEMENELLDLIVVAVRMLLSEHSHPESSDLNGGN